MKGSLGLCTCDDLENFKYDQIVPTTTNDDCDSTCLASSAIRPNEGTVDVHCYKCKTAPAQVSVRGLNSCVACFQVHVEGTIRRTLRLKCGVTRGTRVTLCVSGGEGSLLLSQVLIDGQRGQMEKWNNTLGLDIVSILHVDLLKLFNQDPKVSSLLTELRQFQHSSILTSFLKQYNNLEQTKSVHSQNIINFFQSSFINPFNIPVECLFPINLSFPQTSPNQIINQFTILLQFINQPLQKCDRWVLEDILDIVRYEYYIH